MNRYRDSFPNIRTDCVHELGLWIETFPDHFLDNNFLKFLGWALHDKDVKPRKEAIEVIRRLYQKEAFAVSLENLTTRFKPRLISMLNDVDTDIRSIALSLSVKLLEHGRIDEPQKAEVRKFLVDAENSHRIVAAQFMASEVKESFILPRLAEHEALGGIIQPTNQPQKIKITEGLLLVHRFWQEDLARHCDHQGAD